MQPSAPPHLESTETIFSSSITKLVVFICWLAILADGYDLGIYGAVLPKLLEDKSWALSPAHAGTIASYALFGMFIGAILVGTITDLIGRKWTLICCLALFSITMGLAAIAPSPELFGIWRFIGGIGLGGVIPTASALTVEYSPKKRQSFIYALMFTGYPLGIVLGAILSMFMLEGFGWRTMFGIGMIPLLLIPFIIRYLPESIQFLLSRNRQEEVDQILNRFQIEFYAKNETHQTPSNIRKKNGFLSLFSKEYIKATLLFWITYIMGMFLIYGLNTWLPQMMRQAGYPLGSSLSFLLMLNITAAIGALFAGAIADRIGAKIVISISYLMAAICIGLLTIKPSVTIIYLLIGLAGIGSVGITQILNAYVTQYFPSHIRATSLGWGLGRVGAIAGPILVGIIMTMQYDLVWNFYLFSFAGLLAAISVFFIPTK
ncbi:MFS transporter [Bacillus tropicus]|uniref:MFS transporter n=1 Tax=Bacillus tropicus TaxID=2026188 RepID=UPI000A2087FE|nr:MFS transporter [Bacillus cereus]